MRETIKVEKGDPLYDKLSKLSEEFMKEDTRKIIVVKSDENRKADEVPFVEKYGMYFYIAWDVEDVLVYSSKFNEDEFNKAIMNTEEDARIFPLSSVGTTGPRPVQLDKLDVKNDDWKEVYCVTNESLENGAGILMCDEFMKKLHDKFGDFYLIPSSVHEVMIVPESNNISKDYLNAILKEANNSIDPDDVLSYNIFTCDKEGLHI